MVRNPGGGKASEQAPAGGPVEEIKIRDNSRPVLATPRLQRRTQAVGVGVSGAVGDVRDKIADTAAEARTLTRAASGEMSEFSSVW